MDDFNISIPGKIRYLSGLKKSTQEDFMGGLSIWHWLVLAIYALVLGVPFWKILRRVGLSGWLVIAFAIPGINLVSLWILAFSRWPAIDRK
ncbi:MAG TPA: hypothetical protein PK677_10910 [Acidiphilium sp.]|nr:hypothetical protein [Acidiphilium sp.]HQU25377.1 hypothetical protein [Acidiphilium sp.]